MQEINPIHSWMWLGLLLLLISCYGAKAQQANQVGSIRGTLADSVTGKGVAFATVSLFEKDKLIGGTVTDSLGGFTLSTLPYGTYVATFSAVGYHSTQSPSWTLSLQQPSLQAGLLTLPPEVKTLQTVTVRGQKPLIEQRVDGFIFHVESLPPIAGSDASDVLRQVPLLVVDANGGLSIRGSSRIRVFIDGKPSHFYGSSVAEALKSIPGESIVSVNVITHPSARYDAEGTDGVVNIVIRKIRKNEMNVYVSGILGNRSETLMGNMQRKSGKWVMKADAYFQTYWNQNGSQLERETNQFGIVQKNESRQRGNNFFGGASLLYSIDSLNTLTVGYRKRYLQAQTHTVSDNFTAHNGILAPSFQRLIDTPVDSDGNSFLAGYTGNSKDGRKEFSLLGMYVLTDATNRYDMAQSSSELTSYQENFVGQTLARELIIQEDYTHSFNNSWKWETGGKFVHRALESNNEFSLFDVSSQATTNDSLRSNSFTYQTSVSALYTSLGFEVKKWQFRTGLRYEHTALKATFRDAKLPIPSYANIIPNLLLSRVLDKKSTLKLSYTLRLVRPTITHLNPTVNNSDSLNIQVGNPSLLPEITRRFQVNYSRSGTRLFTDAVLFYNHNRNSIESIRRGRPDGVFETSWQNVGRNQRLGMALTFSWKPTPNFSLGTTLTTQYVWLESPQMSLANQGLMKQLIVNGGYKFPKGYSLDWYGYWDAHQVLLQGSRSGWKFYSLILNKKWVDDRFALSLRLDSFLPRFLFIEEIIATHSFAQRQTNRYQNQNARLTFSYKLGKTDIKSPRMRQVENPE